MARWRPWHRVHDQCTLQDGSECLHQCSVAAGALFEGISAVVWQRQERLLELHPLGSAPSMTLFTEISNHYCCCCCCYYCSVILGPGRKFWPCNSSSLAHSYAWKLDTMVQCFFSADDNKPLYITYIHKNKVKNATYFSHFTVKE